MAGPRGRGDGPGPRLFKARSPCALSPTTGGAGLLCIERPSENSDGIRKSESARRVGLTPPVDNLFRPPAPEWRESKGNVGRRGPGRRRVARVSGGPKKLEYSLLQNF